MPFAQPTLTADSGYRDGSTILGGSLTPVIAPGFQTEMGASIWAGPPAGTISTFVSAGFNAGSPPRGASMLTVNVAGVAMTSRALVQAFGGIWAHAHAELSISIEEWQPPLFGKGGRGIPAKLISRVTFNPTKIFDDWGSVISFQARIDDGTPFVSVAGMPIQPEAPIRLHSFVCWINLYQLAECNAVTGFAQAVSNVQYFFDPPFFSFL